MKNIILLIFNIIFFISCYKPINEDKKSFSNYDELLEYLKNNEILIQKSDSSFYLFIPSSCISCTPWLRLEKFKSINNLVLITSHPSRYFNNFQKIYKDSSNNFLDLSFYQFGPTLVKFIPKEKNCNVYLIKSENILKQIIPNLE